MVSVFAVRISPIKNRTACAIIAVIASGNPANFGPLAGNPIKN